MSIFGHLELEREVQVDDKTRLDSSKSFVSKDEAAITLVEIEPESGDGFVDVTGSSASDWYLDWSYSGASRTVTASVRITTDGAPVVFTKDVEVLIASDDNLFSNDQDIVSLEQDILKWVPQGRNSFLNMHRKAQYLIIEQLNDVGIQYNDQTRLDKDAVVDIDEVRKWSQVLTLALIFEDISNQPDDVYSLKAQFYRGRASEANNKSFFRLDLDKDGTQGATEGALIKSGYLHKI